MKLDLELLPHQAEFILDTTTRDLALVGGRGCGKTYSLAIKLITLAGLQAGTTAAALSPSGPMAAKVLIPEMLDALERFMPKQYRFNKTQRRFDLNFGRSTTEIYILSAENVRDGLGLNLSFFGVDEADTMDVDTALESWRKLSGALRAGNPKHRQKVAVSTPEGYNFMFQHWRSEVLEAQQKLLTATDPKVIADLTTITKRRLIRGRTLDNPYITADVLDDLRASYPANYLAAYLEGEFVNMAGRTVYDSYGFESNQNTTSLKLADISTAETLLHGIDFNNNGMSCVTCVVRGRDVYVIDEILGSVNTFDLAAQLKERYRGYRSVLYPDPAGKQNKTSALNTDHAILRQEGFPLRVMSSAPRIRDRVNSVNAMFCDGNQDRRLHINRVACPGTHKSLITQVWDTDEKPKKGSPIGLSSTRDTYIDGPLDALGYFIYTEYPRHRNGSSPIRITGL